MVSFLELVLGGIRVMLLIRATGCLFESLEYMEWYILFRVLITVKPITIEASDWLIKDF